MNEEVTRLQTRRRMPDRRISDTFRMKFGNLQGSFHVTLGYYMSDYALGEIFINSPKVGTPMESIVRACAVLVSIALQHGANPAELAAALPKEADESQSTVIGAVLEEIMNKKLDRYNPDHTPEADPYTGADDGK